MTTKLAGATVVLLSLVGCGIIASCRSQSDADRTANHPNSASPTLQAPKPSGPPISLTPRQLVVSYTCDQAQAIINDKAKYSALDVNGINEVTAVWENCANEVHDKAFPNDPRVTVVTPTNDPNRTVVVETVDQGNLGQVHDACVTAGKAFFAYAEVASTVTPMTKAVVAGVDVVTNGGKTDCDSFIHGAQTGNPLIVLAPSVIAGSGVTMNVLSMIGAGQTAANVQAAVDKIGVDVKESIASSVNDVVQHPLIYVVPQVTTLPVIPVPVITPPKLPGVPDKVQNCVFHPWSGCV
jgi:hypothetical protein